FSLKPFKGLLHLLDDSSIDIIDDGIDSLCIEEYDGIWKIYKLFLRNGNKNTRDTQSICLGFLFRSREITDEGMKIKIIRYVKNKINDIEVWNRNQSTRSLKGLSYNAEILNEEELKKIEHDLKLLLEESKENRKSTILIQEYWFLLLLIVLDGRSDDELEEESNYEDEYYNGDEDKNYYGYDGEDDEEEEKEDYDD
ncbi:MAG: hypothetical protein EZS28_046006, partial [Streblomastix strix]